MKILLIQSCYEGFGGYFRSSGIASALAKDGHNVRHIFSSRENSLFIKRIRLSDNLTVFKLPRLNLSHIFNGRLIRGVAACFFIIFSKYDIVHIFEAMQLETGIPYVFCRLLRKKVVLDVGDEWLDSPTYNSAGALLKSYIEFCDLRLASSAKFMTVTSEYLEQKYREKGVRNILKLINGVDLGQFQAMPRDEARGILKIGPDKKVILSFGNTYGGDRAYLLLKTFNYLNSFDNSILLYFNMDPRLFLNDPKIKSEIGGPALERIVVTGHIGAEALALYLGACDIILFLTGSRPSEKACFPIRVGSYLNGERVIAIDRTGTEAFNTLSRFNCILTGEGPYELAKNIIDFFNNDKLRRALEERVLKAKKELCWGRLISDLTALYRRIAGGADG